MTGVKNQLSHTLVPVGFIPDGSQRLKRLNLNRLMLRRHWNTGSDFHQQKYIFLWHDKEIAPRRWRWLLYVCKKHRTFRATPKGDIIQTEGFMVKEVTRKDAVKWFKNHRLRPPLELAPLTGIPKLAADFIRANP